MLTAYSNRHRHGKENRLENQPACAPAAPSIFFFPILSPCDNIHAMDKMSDEDFRDTVREAEKGEVDSPFVLADAYYTGEVFSLGCVQKRH